MHGNLTDPTGGLRPGAGKDETTNRTVVGAFCPRLRSTASEDSCCPLLDRRDHADTCILIAHAEERGE